VDIPSKKQLPKRKQKVSAKKTITKERARTRTTQGIKVDARAAERVMKGLGSTDMTERSIRGEAGADWFEIMLPPPYLKKPEPYRQLQPPTPLFEGLFRKIHDSGAYDYVILKRPSEKFPGLETVRFLVRMDEGQADSFKLFAQSFGLTLRRAAAPDVGPELVELEFKDNPVNPLIPPLDYRTQRVDPYAKASEHLIRTIRAGGGGIWLRMAADGGMMREIARYGVRVPKGPADSVLDIFMSKPKSKPGSRAEPDRALELEMEKRKSQSDSRRQEPLLAVRAWVWGKAGQIDEIVKSLPAGPNAVRAFKRTNAAALAKSVTKKPGLPTRERLTRQLVPVLFPIGAALLIVAGVVGLGEGTLVLVGVSVALAMVAYLALRVRNPITLSTRELGLVFSPPQEADKFLLEFTDVAPEEKVFPTTKKHPLRGLQATAEEQAAGAPPEPAELVRRIRERARDGEKE